MPQITDKQISKVYEGKVIEGKGQYFNFYLKGGEKKFGLFVAKGKTIPKDGMRVALLDWETTQDGQYENNKVKNIVWMGVTKTVTGKAPDKDSIDKNSPIWFCLSYAKDIEVAFISAGLLNANITLNEVCLGVADSAMMMLKRIQSGKTEPEAVPEKDAVKEAENTDVSDDEIPF